MIKIFGDSITKGSPGLSYCDYLNKKFKIKSYGVGGDTIIGLNTRLKKSKINSDDFVIIEIGTNDILLPCLRALSTEWKSTVSSIEKSGRKITDSISEFKNMYNEILENIETNNVALINIPCIGEIFDSSVNNTVNKYNKIIRDLSVLHRCIYIDFNIAQKELIRNASIHNSGYLIRSKPYKMILDVIVTKNKSFVDYISNKRGLVTTVDGVHLNKVGAMKLADMVSAVLEENT